MLYLSLFRSSPMVIFLLWSSTEDVIWPKFSQTFLRISLSEPIDILVVVSKRWPTDEGKMGCNGADGRIHLHFFRRSSFSEPSLASFSLSLCSSLQYRRYQGLQISGTENKRFLIAAILSGVNPLGSTVTWAFLSLLFVATLLDRQTTFLQRCCVRHSHRLQSSNKLVHLQNTYTRS